MRTIVWVVWLWAAAAWAGPPSSFGPGEQTTYEVSYLGVVAGRAQLTVGWPLEQFGAQVWPLVCVGETSATFNGVWPVRDRFISYWAPDQQRSLGADFFVDENKHKRRERYRYEVEQRRAVVTRWPERKAPWEFTVEHLSEDVHDLASAGFGLRNVALVPGEVHELPVFTGQKQFLMKATVVGRELLRTQLGELEVYRVTVNADFSGQLATTGLITLFYTADARQFPVRAEAEFLLGKVMLDAVEYEPGRANRESP